MKTWWQRWRLAALVAAAMLVFFVGLAAHGGLWRALGVHDMKPFYADTVTILSASETWAAGGDPYRNNFRDPYGRPHSYGPWWLYAAQLGLTQQDAWWLGSLLALSFLATVVTVVAPRRAGEAAWLFVLLASPGMLLALERGNNDLAIVVLLAGAAWLFVRLRPALGDGAAAATLVSAGLLKFYPLISVVALAARPGKLLGRVWLGLGCGVAFLALWTLQGQHYAKAFAEAARPMSVFTYGLPLAPMSWQLLASQRLWLVVGAAPFLSVGAWLLWRHRAMWWELLPATGGRVVAALGGGSAWVLCYLMTTNFPYRASLLFLVLPFWLGERAGRAGRVLVGLLAFALWLHLPKYRLSATAESLAAPDFGRAMALLSGMDQAIIAVVTLALSVSLVGWAWRRVRAG